MANSSFPIKRKIVKKNKQVKDRTRAQKENVPKESLASNVSKFLKENLELSQNKINNIESINVNEKEVNTLQDKLQNNLLQTQTDNSISTESILTIDSKLSHSNTINNNTDQNLLENNSLIPNLFEDQVSNAQNNIYKDYSQLNPEEFDQKENLESKSNNNFVIIDFSVNNELESFKMNENKLTVPKVKFETQLDSINSININIPNNLEIVPNSNNQTVDAIDNLSEDASLDAFEDLGPQNDELEENVLIITESNENDQVIESKNKFKENKLSLSLTDIGDKTYSPIVYPESKTKKDKILRVSKSFDNISELFTSHSKKIKLKLPLLNEINLPSISIKAHIPEIELTKDIKFSLEPDISTENNFSNESLIPYQNSVDDKRKIIELESSEKISVRSSNRTGGNLLFNENYSFNKKLDSRMRAIEELRKKYAIVIGSNDNEVEATGLGLYIKEKERRFKRNDNQITNNSLESNLPSIESSVTINPLISVSEIEIQTEKQNEKHINVETNSKKLRQKSVRERSKSLNGKIFRSKSPLKRKPQTQEIPLYKQPIEFFQSKTQNLQFENFDEQMRVAKLQQIKLPLVLVFNQRRQSITSPDEPTFSSDFESGNLQQVWRDNSGEYFLFLHTDRGSFNCLWFHFFMGNLKAGNTYVLNICNIANKAHNWNRGYQPCMKIGIDDSKFWRCTYHDNAYADESSDLGFSGWKKFGENCLYFKTQSTELKKRARVLLGQHKQQRTRTLYTLRFQFTVTKKMEAELNSFSKDSGAYIAFSYPYTYSDMCRNLLRLGKNVNKRMVKFSIDTLCCTVLGRDVSIISITSNSVNSKKPKKIKASEAENYSQEDNDIVMKRSSKKPVIFISCRVHPGESCGSHVLSGILDFLCLSSNRVAKSLLANFQFKIVPMLNPDGVIDGYQRSAPTSNSKSADEGVNLNEIYDIAEKKLHPTVYATKRIVQKLASTRTIPLFLDLHGHYNSSYAAHFLYGYTDESNLGNYNLDIYRFAKKLEDECSKYPNGHGIFLNKDELIRSNSYKKPGVAPVFFSSQFGIQTAFTVESCMHTSQEYQFTPKDYYNYGRVICHAIFETFEYMLEK